MLIFISGSSGVGKDTVIEEWKKLNRRIIKTVNYTTRPSRAEEKNGVSYHFVSESDFSLLVGQGYFADYRNIFGNWYGISKADLSQSEQGAIVVANLDVEGVKKLSQIYPSALKVFLLSPSEQILMQRLNQRGEDTEPRINRFSLETSYANLYEIKIANIDSSFTAQRLEKIIQTHCLEGAFDDQKD